MSPGARIRSHSSDLATRQRTRTTESADGHLNINSSKMHPIPRISPAPTGGFPPTSTGSQPALWDLRGDLAVWPGMFILLGRFETPNLNTRSRTMQRDTTQQRKVERVDVDTKHDVKDGYQIELKKVRLTSYSFSGASSSSGYSGGIQVLMGDGSVR